MAEPRKEPLAGADPRVSSGEPILMGEGEAMYHESACPICDAPDAVLRTFRLDIPYFGEVFETIFICSKCGFKHADTMLPHRGAAMEYKIEVTEERDLFVRAVKSSSATVAVPELGLLWEPGPASTAEVTNVEGLLRRFEDAVHRAISLFDTKQTQLRGDKLIRKLNAIIEGTERATVILKDPYGNSALLDERGKVKERKIGEVEMTEMLTGEYVIDMDGGKPTGLRRTTPAKRR